MHPWMSNPNENNAPFFYVGHDPQASAYVLSFVVHYGSGSSIVAHGHRYVSPDPRVGGYVITTEDPHHYRIKDRERERSAQWCPLKYQKIEEHTTLFHLMVTTSQLATES
jgi:hypothetical protein